MWANSGHSTASPPPRRARNGGRQRSGRGCAPAIRFRRQPHPELPEPAWSGFCSRCGTPLLYERKCWPHIVNIPRALFTGRIGREPRYHAAIEELPDWAYTGNRLAPLKGYPGIVWERPKSRRRPRDVDDLDVLDRRVASARARIVR